MALNQSHFTPWTPEQNELLTRLFPNPRVSPAEMECALGKTWSAIAGRAHRMRLRRPAPDEWRGGELEKLAQLYPDRAQTPSMIEAQIGRPWSAIMQKARRVGLNRPISWSPAEDLRLAELYPREDIAPAEIERQLGRNWGAIEGRAHTLGIHRPRPNRHQIRKSYFRQIDSDEKAYFLGLIAADGSVAERGTLDIELQLRDAHLVEKLRDTIAPAAPLRIRHGLRLYIQARAMTNDLAQYGIVPRKSYHFDWPGALQEHLAIPFILGYFDGDGSLRRKNENNGWGWELLGCAGFLEAVRVRLERHAGVSIRAAIRAVKDRSPHLYRLQVTGRRVLEIDRVLNMSGLGLARKHVYARGIPIE